MKTKLISFMDLKKRFDSVDLDNIIRLRWKYENDYKEFNYQLFQYITNWNNYNHNNTIQVNIMGTNIDYLEIWHKLTTL